MNQPEATEDMTREEAYASSRRLEEEEGSEEETLVGAGVGTSTFSNEAYQIFAWLSLFLAFVLFGVCYSLYTMDIAKDTLLYAKFIATDQH